MWFSWNAVAGGILLLYVSLNAWAALNQYEMYCIIGIVLFMLAASLVLFVLMVCSVVTWGSSGKRSRRRQVERRKGGRRASDRVSQGSRPPLGKKPVASEKGGYCERLKEGGC